MKIENFSVSSICVYRLFEKAGLDIKYFQFSGQSCGECTCFPYTKYTYNTVANGELEKFYKGSDNVKEWTKVYEWFSEGDARTPDRYIAIYVKDTEKYNELLNKLHCALKECLKNAELSLVGDYYKRYEGYGKLNWFGEEYETKILTENFKKVSIEYIFI